MPLASLPGNYETMSYKQPLIVDKTKFTVGDAWYYSSLKDTSFANNERKPPINFHYLEKYPENENYKESRLPAIKADAWYYANERSKKEGLDTAYYRDDSGDISLDTSASGYRVPFEDEWYILMRAGASTAFFWGNELSWRGEIGKGDEELLRVSKYAWINFNLGPNKNPDYRIELRPVAQLLPNQFGLYDMIGIVPEFCDSSPESFIICHLMLGGGDADRYRSFRFIRQTPKLHKLDKF